MVYVNTVRTYSKGAHVPMDKAAWGRDPRPFVPAAPVLSPTPMAARPVWAMAWKCSMIRVFVTAACVVLLNVSGCQAQPTLPDGLEGLEDKAISGDAQAQYALGAAYDTGDGVPRNRALATQWYKKAAEQGHAGAQNSLGSVFQAEKKYSDALYWYQKAAAQDHPLATSNLAYLYDLGLGVPQDRRMAQELYLRAANLGWAEAMFNLANMYGAGQLGAVDLYQAYIWCDRSARYASPQSEVLRRSMECIGFLNRELSSEQLRRAQGESKNWAPNTALKPTQ